MSKLENFWVCMRCGAINQKADSRCWRCGARRPSSFPWWFVFFMILVLAKFSRIYHWM